MPAPPTHDYFDRVRSVAAAGLLAAAAAAIIGSLMAWVTITPPPVLPESEVPNVQPFTGIEARDGWIVIVGAVLVILSTISLIVRRRSGYAWIAFFVWIVIGGIAIADYRGVSELSSSISERMNIVGEAEPAVGIMLVAAAALVGVISAVTAVAATPRMDQSLSTE